MLHPASRLPGIYFHTESPPAVSELPRMDVAGFVGFSSIGPLHTPVAIEAYGQFREIFGDDVPLAWDSVQRRMQYSLLGSCVEAFFRNGGRRCWVVRVAQETDTSLSSGAITQRFILPGLFHITESGEQAAEVLARSPGRWADNLRVGTRLRVRSLTPNLRVESASPPSAVFTTGEGEYCLHIKSAPADLGPGDLIELRFGDSGLRVYFFIDELMSIEHGMVLKSGQAYWYEDGVLSSPYVISPSEISAESVLPLWLDEADGLDRLAVLEMQSPAIVPVIRRLRFDIQVWKGEARYAHLAKLAFDQRHPRFWGNMPSDQQLYGELLLTNPVNLEAGLSEFLADLSHPRFPLAADSTLMEDTSAVFLPLSMLSYSDFSMAASARGITSPPSYKRDGLETFDAGLFLDVDLAEFSTTTLLSEAEHKRFIRKQDLKGIHSLLPVDEVSMIAAPDCVHRHWDLNPPPFEAGIPAPNLYPLSLPDEYGRRSLGWSPVADIRCYRVQQSLSPDFTQSTVYVINRPSRLELVEDDTLTDAPETDIKLVFSDECSHVYYFRVRAEGYGEVSPWSNSRASRIPETHFYSCERPDTYLLGLALEATVMSPEDEMIRFSWQAEDEHSLVDTLADSYQLQRAGDADFVSAQILYQGDSMEQDMPLHTDAVVYYRVRALAAGIAGPWSNTWLIPPDRFSAQTLNEVEVYDHQDLLAVHYALIRFCAARSDAIAILSMPVHYQDSDVSAHLDALIPPDFGQAAPGTMHGSGDVQVPTLAWSERAALSYAALYFPWLRYSVNREFETDKNRETSRVIPPEGAVCGQMAVSANRRGAWVASANKALQDVLGLSHQLTDPVAVSLIDKQVNVIRQDPRGILASSEDTLSRAEEFRPINVRRLMTLLRRLVSRDGTIYLFEPNSRHFRDSVENYWEQVLSNLYQRGALRGDSANAAFRVVADESVNDERSRALGRFIVELHIAASRPMTFINVRLVQSGPDQQAMQEF